MTIQIEYDERVLDSFTSHHGYQKEVKVLGKPDERVPNPESKVDFMRSKIIQYIKDGVLGYESQRASEEARQAAIQKVETEVVIS